MPNLTHVDWLIVLLYCFFVLGIGYALRLYMKTGKDFFQAGRALPAWLCGLAFIGVSLSGPEVIGMGAAGAQFGLHSARFYAIGAIPAMVFVGLFMMPLYYGSKARTVPDFLRLRFGGMTSALNACMFLAMTVFSAGISLFAMARLIQALHLFDALFFTLGWPREGIFIFSILLSAAIVMAYVLLGGLAGAMYNQVLQFFLLVAGFLPLVLIGLGNIGGWSGLMASLPAAGIGAVHAGSDGLGLGLGLGLVLGAGFWCTDFRILQTAMAANNIESARRAPLIAAVPRLFLPFLLILPGIIAVGLPTPHSSTTVSTTADGAIVHETTIVPPQVAQGKGLVPAQADPLTGKPMLSAAGQPLLDYDMATPNLLLHFLPTGLLGLGITALLACFMSGIAAGITAFISVFTGDLYKPWIRPDGSGAHFIAVGRWATVGFILLSVAAAYAAAGFSNILDALLLVFSIINAPLFATVLLGMFWKRATGHGAFAGLLAGTAAALLHHGLTLPLAAQPGL
ncbi:MAG: Na+/galactose cotransporter, partial [Terracidiphilus sp.]|nr:Na+/galactose cotransporter [Terracidiphilus sp.]